MSNNIIFPVGPINDPQTGILTVEWRMFLLNLQTSLVALIGLITPLVNNPNQGKPVLFLEDGEEGQPGIPGRNGIDGRNGLSIPGLDGQDGDDNFSLPAPASGLYLAANTPLFTGNVVGPTSATSGSVALFDGSTGKLIKDGGVLGSAAFTASSAYDASGSASTVQGNLNTHTAATGSSVHGLGTASTHAATDFQAAGTYVTSVGGTAPVATTGGTAPTISMAAATASVDGYLTHTDWNTFNSKQPAGSYLTGNQTITLGGVLSGSGATSITASFASTPWTGNGANGTASGLYGTPNVSIGNVTSNAWGSFSGSGNPASGASLEVGYGNIYSGGNLYSFDRTGGAATNLTLWGLIVRILTGAGGGTAHTFSTTGFSSPTLKVNNANGYISSDGSTGYTGTVTTASLVGKTLTIKDGIVTSFV